MKIGNCNPLFNIFLLLSYLSLGMAWAGGTLFSDDFEGDTVGKEGSLWELAGGVGVGVGLEGMELGLEIAGLS